MFECEVRESKFWAEFGLPGVCLPSCGVESVEVIRILNISVSGWTPASGVKCFTKNQIASLQTYHLIDTLQNKIIIFNITAY